MEGFKYICGVCCFLTQRAADIWIALPEQVVESDTIINATLKSHLDRYIIRQGIERYGSNVGKWD